MNEKLKVIQSPPRSGRWVIVPPKGYAMPGFIWNGGYGFGCGQSATMDIARRNINKFAKEQDA